MNTEKNYWMFRVKPVGSQPQKTSKFCLNNNVVTYGWAWLKNKLAEDPEKALQEICKHGRPRALSMARNFSHMKKGDILVLPLSWGGIAIGEFTSDALWKEEWIDSDAANYFEVKWLTKWHPRNELSSAFQSSLKYRGTFLNLWRYTQELDNLISSGFKRLDEKFQENTNEKNENSKNKIAEHINTNQNLFFGDTEFEYFMMHLFELQYPGLKTQKNTAPKEAYDGKDFTGTINYENIGIDITLNVQVKQHQGNASAHGLYQIDKSDAEGEYDKNILVTLGKKTDEMEKIAGEKGIILLDNQDIAEMIIENFDAIEEKYKAKLNLTREITILK